MPAYSRRTLLRIAVASLAASACLSNVALAQPYPTRPITLIVPWGAGGGTDATARIIGSLLEKELGQPVNVVNRAGGSGVVGHAAIASAAPDGYTIGLATVEIGMMHWQGLTELTGASYTPLALVNADPAGVQVRADAPYKNDQRPAGGDQGESGQAQGLGNRPGRHLASRARRAAARPEDRSGRRALGSEQRRRAGIAGHGCRRSRHRAVFATRGARADRCRQGQEPRHHERQAVGALSECADAEGCDRQRLDDGRVARHGRSEGNSAGSARQAGGRAARRSPPARTTPTS